MSCICCSQLSADMYGLVSSRHILPVRVRSVSSDDAPLVLPSIDRQADGPYCIAGRSQHAVLRSAQSQQDTGWRWGAEGMRQNAVR